MNNQDLDLLSAYLDGQLSASEAARLESRLRADPQLEATLAELRAARKLLRALPQRKAPRNFTLTRKMVGLNPPLPHSYAFFRATSAFASALLVFTFVANALAPRLSYIGAAGGMGGGGYSGLGIGGGVEEGPALLAPAAEAPALAESAPPPEDESRVAPTAEAPMMKKPAAENQLEAQSQPPVEKSAPFSPAWQAALLTAAALGAIAMFVQREWAKRKWH